MKPPRLRGARATIAESWRWRFLAVAVSALTVGSTSSCRVATPEATAGLHVIVVESFLADITRAIAGPHVAVEALIPLGADPHAFEPTPADARRVADSDLLIANGAGFDTLIIGQLVGGAPAIPVIEAAAGLELRPTSAGSADAEATENDPHLWLDPINVIGYVENIRAGLSDFDPQHASDFAANAETYTAQLMTLDEWIRDKVQTVPADRRLLVTNHESLGYFAARYGFAIVGAVIPSVSTSASPSAKELTALVGAIRDAHVPAIFLETGADPRLATQLAQEAGVRVVSDLYTESLSPPDGPAPTYLDMMRHNTLAIVTALGAP